MASAALLYLRHLRRTVAPLPAAPWRALLTTPRLAWVRTVVLPVTIILAAFPMLALLAVLWPRETGRDGVVFAGCGFACVGLGLAALVVPTDAAAVALPLFLPGLAGGLILDPLSRPFLLLVNLGGMTASFYGWGGHRAGAGGGGGRLQPFRFSYSASTWWCCRTGPSCSCSAGS